MAYEIMHDDYEPLFIIKCHQWQDWPKWKEAIQAELFSLTKRNVFWSVARNPDNVNLVRYKCIFV